MFSFYFFLINSGIITAKMQTQNKNLTGLEYRSVAECWPGMHEALSMMHCTLTQVERSLMQRAYHKRREVYSQIHLLKEQYVNKILPSHGKNTVFV